MEKLVERQNGLGVVRTGARSTRILAVLWAGVMGHPFPMGGVEPGAPNPLPAVHENAIWRELLDEGVSVGVSFPVKLPRPTMADDLDPTAQRTAIEGIADANHPRDQLIRDSVVAPFQLRIEAVMTDKDAAPARRVDLWFVGHGKLDALWDEEFRSELFKIATGKQDPDFPDATDALPPKRLQSRGIEPPDEGPTDGSRPLESYVTSQFNLFDRVRVSANRHGMITRTPASIVVAAMTDRRFDDDPDGANAWRSLTKAASGKLEAGEQHPYKGGGFYVKVTQMLDPPDGLFVEYHQVFEEPQEWFQGANLLRSKLPLVVQDTVRKFRRKLKEASKATAKEGEQ